MKDCKSCSCVDPGTCVECLKGQLERYKEALRLIKELDSLCPPDTDREVCGDHCRLCIVNYDQIQRRLTVLNLGIAIIYLVIIFVIISFCLEG